jgi:hypothetical protein
MAGERAASGGSQCVGIGELGLGSGEAEAVVATAATALAAPAATVPLRAVEYRVSSRVLLRWYRK